MSDSWFRHLLRHSELSFVVEAWERRDHLLMWCLARKLGGKKTGPKKRFFNVPSSIKPSSSDWKDFLCGPRGNGGCEGVQANWPHPEPLGLQKRITCRIPSLGKRTSAEDHERTFKRKCTPCRTVLVDPLGNLANVASPHAILTSVKQLHPRRPKLS